MDKTLSIQIILKGVIKMKNVKLSLFITALTLAIAIPSGAYAQGNDSKTKSRDNKIECKTVRTQECSEKYMQNSSYKKDDSKKHVEYKKDESKKRVEYKKDECKQNKDYKKEDKNKCVKPDIIKKKCIDKKVVISAEDKAALQVKKEAIVKVKVANKVLKTTIKTNKEAIKVELKRIKESNLIITPEVQATIDEFLLTMKNEHKQKMHSNCCAEVIKTEVTPINAIVEPTVEVKPVDTVVVPPVEEVKPDTTVVDTTIEVKPEEPAVEVIPVDTVVEPIKEVIPVTTVVEPIVEVEKTYIEKLKARLDNKLIAYTAKNAKLTELSAKILSLLDALKLIK